MGGCANRVGLSLPLCFVTSKRLPPLALPSFPNLYHPSQIQPRQAPVPFHRKNAQNDNKQYSKKYIDMVFHPARPQGQEKHPTGDAGRSVDLLPENERHLIAERIAQHSTKDRRDGAHHYGNHRREPHRQGLVEPQDGKQPDADGVEKEHGTPQAQDVTMEEIGGQNASGYDQQIIEIFHPADGGGAHQDIPDGAPTQGCQECNYEPSEEVELLLRRREQAADSENEGARQVEGVNEIHSML